MELNLWQGAHTRQVSIELHCSYTMFQEEPARKRVRGPNLYFFYQVSPFARGVFGTHREHGFIYKNPFLLLHLLSLILKHQKSNSFFGSSSFYTIHLFFQCFKFRTSLLHIITSTSNFISSNIIPIHSHFERSLNPPNFIHDTFKILLSGSFFMEVKNPSVTLPSSCFLCVYVPPEGCIPMKQGIVPHGVVCV